MKTLIAPLLLFGLLLGLAHEAKSATVLYAMTDNGRLYRSTDGAKSWQNIALPATPYVVFQAFAVDPENSSNLYVDVGLVGRGVPGQQQQNYFFRSTDGGATWSQTIFPNGATADLLAVDPASSNIIYAGLNGLSRSTDSGVTWSATSITTFVEGISTDAHRAGVVYVTTTDGKIYKSTDFGATWTSLASSLPPQFNRLLSVAADPNNGSVLWGTGEGSCPASNNIPFACGVVQSSDGGKTWQAISSVKGWFKNVVVDSRNGNIYAGGKDPTETALPPLVVRSTDGGKTWAKITTGMSKFSVEVHLDPENAANLYGGQANLPGAADVGPGGGVYVSTNGGASWTLNPVDASQSVSDIVAAFAAVSSKTPSPAAPTISANGVVNGASFQPGVTANSWVTIQGTNLAPGPDDWSHSIVNGALPTSLDGVSVTMGGKPAYIYYITPGQLNVLAPDIIAGPVTVTVTAPGGSVSAATTASLYSPAFFLWPGNQVVATRQDFSFAVKPGTFAGATTVAAKPGDVLILWATGFGPTSPAVTPGVAVPGDRTYATATLPSVTINNTSANVFGAALAPGSAGLYQIAIQVPATLADGDSPIQANAGGVLSPTGVILSIAR